MKDFSKKYYPYILFNVLTVIVVALMILVTQATAKPERSSAMEGFTSGVLSYQGTLMGAMGEPLNGTYEITFRIYNVPSGGTALWEEERTGVNSVPVEKGLFNVMLGSLTPIPDSIWESAELFLGVKIGTDVEMNPREKMTFVPAAISANVAQLALSVPDGSITKSKLAPDVSNYLIQTGDLSCDYSACSGWILNTGSGVRQYTKHITYPTAYPTPPKVFANIHGFDLDYRVNSRVDVMIKNITTSGFDVVYHTYADSIVYGVFASWTAFGTK